LEKHPAVLVTYQFSGALDEIYATLVVRLHHTPAFDKERLWRYAADFRTLSGKQAGLKMTRQSEGAAEIAVYFEPGIPDDTKVTFIRYIHEHLHAKAQPTARLRHYVCPFCNTPVEDRKTALARLERGEKNILCVNCEKRVPLWDLIEQKFSSEKIQRHVQELHEQSRASIDNESRKMTLINHALTTAQEAGQIFNPITNSQWGLDGEIEFKDSLGADSGKRVYLWIESTEPHLSKPKVEARETTGRETIKIKTPRHAEQWQLQAYQVMVVIRTSGGQIRWMNVTDYLVKHGTKTKQITFEGEAFTALNVVRLRDKLLAKSTATSPIS
jgi:hypothetical protein